MINLKPGESGYFSTPTETLDPYLFEGTHLLPDARTRISKLLLDYLSTQYNNPESWTTIWLAGSGVSYQWSAARGNGDLDVLFGIDYDKFIADNPNFAFDTRDEIAGQIDDDLRKNLWPDTAHVPFYAHKYQNGFLTDVNYYEITFFFNPLVGAGKDDILNIHPYAAYNLTDDEWTTKPARVGSPVFQHPAEFSVAADRNFDATKVLVDRYNALRSEGSGLVPNSPQEVNNRRSKALVVTEARNLLDHIHLGRRAAFTGFGQGYGDFYNYQWQRGKADGIIRALNSIIANES